MPMARKKGNKHTSRRPRRSERPHVKKGDPGPGEERVPGQPPAEEARTALILARLRSGYYRRPDVLAEIAARLADDLQGPLD